jgi:hypothetical protein
MPAAFAQVSGARGGSSVGQSSGLIIRRSQVQVLPAPPIYLRIHTRGSRATGAAHELRIVADKIDAANELLGLPITT